jgi:hypothetical protein
MTSLKQWAANRESAQKSTGPRTEEGKRRSRRNAVRHGLTAETVIEAFEDAEDYRAGIRLEPVLSSIGLTTDQIVKRRTVQAVLNDLPLELDRVAAVLGHGAFSSKTRPG